MALIDDKYEELVQFGDWLRSTSTLAESSIEKYRRSVRVISQEMLDAKVIGKSFLKMSAAEIDAALPIVFGTDEFIEKNKIGNNMYRSALKHFRLFSYEMKDNSAYQTKVVENIMDDPALTITEKMAIVRSRVGQGEYRNKLLRKYDSRCVVTGINDARLLIASHIKPWFACGNKERLDVENGLLLSSNMDKLFDNGLISFEGDGHMIISGTISEFNRKHLYLDKDTKVDLKAGAQMKQYLEYHRDVLFIK